MNAPPRFATPRTERPTYGHQVAKLAELLGFAPMPHQRLFWDVALEHDGHGDLAYREVCLGLPRQNGKTVALLCLMVWRCLRWPGQVLKYAAQTGLDARAKMSEDFWPALEHSPLAELVRFSRQSGHEQFIFDNGSRLGLLASSEKSGHGATLTGGSVLDECWAFQDFRMEQSCKPAMVTCPNAQLYCVSTAGSQHQSPFWWAKVQTGRQAADAGVTRDIAYLEWSAGDEDDPSLSETWRKAIPALDRTIHESTIRGDFQSMPRHEFERAFLNRFVTAIGESVVSPDAWERLAAPNARKPERVTLGVDVAPRSKSAAIAAAGRLDGNLCVSVLEHGPGTEWLAPRLAELHEQLGEPEVIVDPKACAAILPELDDVGVTEITGNDLADACAYVLDLVERGKLRHRDQRELTVAIDGAQQRPLGDSFAWSRKGSGVDICPLVAVTLACWAWRWAEDDE